jgi:hypothetical protein
MIRNEFSNQQKILDLEGQPKNVNPKNQNKAKGAAVSVTEKAPSA